MRLRMAARLVASLALVLTCSGTFSAQEPTDRPSVPELKKLSVEELMALRVTSVSRREERLGSAAAAVSVVTNEDIRRAGATTVPEALRLVPGLHVARQTSSGWVVAARGFSSVNSEKLLVLSDTRSIYTPLFSGVFWDVQDYLLQDIDRIEVIRGPGATLWGSNAVNGVINITTKSARDTQGTYFQTETGSDTRATVAARYGGRLSDTAYYRIFGKYFDVGSTYPHDRPSPDDWQTGHAGFRIDWDATKRDALTVQGDLYRGDVGQLSPSIVVSGRPGPEGPFRVATAGGNLLARWRRTMSPDSEVQLRAYYDRTHRNDPMFVDDLDTVDVDLQHRRLVAGRHEMTVGANYRLFSHENEGRILFRLEPAASRDQLVGGFVQDQIRLGEAVRLTLGTKLEHNDFSGGELQPSGRVAWQPTTAHMFWGAVSRAVRVPTRIERDIAVDASDPAGNPVVRLLGNRQFGAEELVAYEAGHRWGPVPWLSTDVTVFRNRYDGLASFELADPFVEPASGRTIVPVHNENLTSGRVAGVEAIVTYAPVRWSRLSISYAHLDMRLEPGGDDLNRSELLDGATPRHQFGVRSSFDLPTRLQVDGLFRSLSALDRLPPVMPTEGVPGYAELDMRLAWLGWRNAEVSLIGRSLLHDRHREFGAPGSSGEVERSVHAVFAWGF